MIEKGFREAVSRFRKLMLVLEIIAIVIFSIHIIIELIFKQFATALTLFFSYSVLVIIYYLIFSRLIEIFGYMDEDNKQKEENTYGKEFNRLKYMGEVLGEMYMRVGQEQIEYINGLISDCESEISKTTILQKKEDEKLKLQVLQECLEKAREEDE